MTKKIAIAALCIAIIACTTPSTPVPTIEPTNTAPSSITFTAKIEMKSKSGDAFTVYSYRFSLELLPPVNGLTPGKSNFFRPICKLDSGSSICVDVISLDEINSGVYSEFGTGQWCATRKDGGYSPPLEC